jgi:hypothetical protein
MMKDPLILPTRFIIQGPIKREYEMRNISSCLEIPSSPFLAFLQVGDNLGGSKSTKWEASKRWEKNLLRGISEHVPPILL